MRDKYDFRGKEEVSEKHYKVMQKGYTKIIHKSDSSIVVKETHLIFLGRRCVVSVFSRFGINK